MDGEGYSKEQMMEYGKKVQEQVFKYLMSCIHKNKQEIDNLSDLYEYGMAGFYEEVKNKIEMLSKQEVSFNGKQI